MSITKKEHKFITIDGKQIAEELLLGLRKKILESKITPGLAVILVGDDEPSKLYVKNKKKACEKVGINFHKYLCQSETENQIINMIHFLNNDPAVSGIIVQLPLPKKYDTQKIINAIDPKKDADGFHPDNIKKILSGESSFYPPLVKTVLHILDCQKIRIKGKNIAIISKSNIFCPVVVKALENKGAKAESMMPEEKNFHVAIKNADIVMSAIGKPEYLKGEMLKNNAVVIDIGISKTKNGYMGDVDFESIQKVARAATPTPGGVGPVTVAMLLKSTLDLAIKQKKE